MIESDGVKSDHLEGRWEDLCGRVGSMFSSMDIIPGKDKDGGSFDNVERPTGSSLCDSSLLRLDVRSHVEFYTNADIRWGGCSLM